MGNASSRNITAVDKATLALKNQRDSLQRYQKKIRHVTDLETEAAKDALRKGDKKRALLALRRKKYQESLLEKTDNQLFELEKLVSSIDFALVQKDVYYGLQQGTAVLKEINAEMKIENVERLMEDTADAIAYQEEISEMLGSRISNADAEEVELELERMEAELSGAQKLPSVPKTEASDLPDAVEDADQVEVEPQKQKQKQKPELLPA